MAPLSNLSPPSKLVFLLMLILVGFFIALLLGMLLVWPLFHVNLLTDMGLVNDIGNPSITGLLKFLQILQSIGLFIIPPIVAGYFFGKNPFLYLKLNFSKTHIFLLTFLFMFISLPLINWMITLNEMMHLPTAFQSVEKWMKEAETQAAMLTDIFLKADSVEVYILNLFMIALIPAIGEEFLFRGVLQRIFGEWCKNIHIAIFISAFLFGAIHLQFYGFLPRLMLGILFGYLFYWSGSLWVAVFAHFINNAAAVTASFLSQKGIIDTDYENLGATDNIFIITLSTVVCAIILFVIKKRSVNSQINFSDDK